MAAESIPVPIIDYEELELVTKARTGDQAAFSSLVNRYVARFFVSQ